MTTPDKEEMPTDRTAGPWIVHYGEAVKIKDANGYTVASLSQIHLHGRRSKNEVAKTAQFIVTACNAYEPMREALILAEKADRIHSKCQECEDGAQAPEACGDCFPSADDARVARRNVLKSLGVRMRDVDRARAIKAEPSICNCSQEDVHDYGPCGEDCRSLVVSTLPVNDRHHSGSDSYQADAGAPALSEKVNGAEGWQPDVCCCISSDAIYEVRRLLNAQNVPAAAFIDDHVGNAIAQRNILAGCLSRMRELIDAALTEAKVTISNEPERDAVSLNQSLHHTQSKEG